MSRRGINPDTGEPKLTYREQMFINEYSENGGNCKDAAVAAGYGPARADQSAYQVLHRIPISRPNPTRSPPTASPTKMTPT